MTLSEYILEETNDGIDMARLLIDVMNGFIRGVTPGHRLAAARLLTIYGFQDARDFIDDNTLPPSDEGRHWVVSDPELARLIRTRTNDGQEMCDFLIDVMWGKVERTRVGHRVSAARELLNRAFGRNQGIPLPKPPRRTAPRGTIKRTDLQTESESVEEQPPLPQGWGEGEKVVRPEPVEGQSEPTHQPVPASVRPVENPPRRELVEGQSEPTHQPVSAPVRPELVEGQSEPALPEGVTKEKLSLYRAASKCISPNFDPMIEIKDLEVTDEEYFRNYDSCDNISCPFHGDPEDPDYIPNYDPNTHHY